MKKRFVSVAAAATLCLSAPVAYSNDPVANYIVAGDAVSPWELSLNFGKTVLENNVGETVRGSLVAEPATRNAENDAIRFTWSPKGVKNEWGTDDTGVQTITLINRMAHVDISSVVDQAALTMDVRVIKAPSKLVTLTLEAEWDWKARAGVPLKSVLRKIPKKEWISVPIPLRCFLKDNEDFDFSKLTGIQLQTGGKMQIEISDLRLTAFPPDQVSCG